MASSSPEDAASDVAVSTSSLILLISWETGRQTRGVFYMVHHMETVSHLGISWCNNTGKLENKHEVLFFSWCNTEKLDAKHKECFTLCNNTLKLEDKHEACFSLCNTEKLDDKHNACFALCNNTGSWRTNIRRVLLCTITLGNWRQT